MIRWATIASLLLGAAVFGLWLPLAHLMKILQPMIVALSIMAAALLVRLNRGMPTLDWKSLEPDDLKLLTSKIVELTIEYMTVLSVHAVTLIFLLVIAVTNTAALQQTTQAAIMAAAGGLVALCAARMAYIVWRDYDIVRLQKRLIDESADKEAAVKASKVAESKVASMRASTLRGAPKPDPLPWAE